MVNYQDEGKGPTILLLHGWGSELSAFAKLSKYLSENYRVISLDLPGFGSTQVPNSDWHVKEYAEFVHSFLKKKKIKRLYAVAGHSFGGRVIIKGISEKLIDPQKVILIGSAGVKPPKSTKANAYKVAAKTGKALTTLPGLSKLRPKLRSGLYKSAGTSDYLNAKEMQKIFLNIVNEDLMKCAMDISQPTLLLWGENDSETPVADGETLAQCIPFSKLYVMKNAGHYAHLDAPELVNSKIDEFLQ